MTQEQFEELRVGDVLRTPYHESHVMLNSTSPGRKYEKIRLEQRCNDELGGWLVNPIYTDKGVDEPATYIIRYFRFQLMGATRIEQGDMEVI
jgi:hypothetical protein